MINGTFAVLLPGGKMAHYQGPDEDDDYELINSSDSDWAYLSHAQFDKLRLRYGMQQVLGVFESAGETGVNKLLKTLGLGNCY